MFKGKSKNPIGFAADTLFDAFLPKKKPSHKKRNAVLVVLGSVGAAALAGALGKKDQQG